MHVNNNIVGCQAPCLRKQHNSLVASTKNLQEGLSRGREKSINVPRGLTSYLSGVSHRQAELHPSLFSLCNDPVWVTRTFHLQTAPLRSKGVVEAVGRQVIT